MTDTDSRRALPSVDSVLRDERLAQLGLDRELVVRLIREAIDGYRGRVEHGANRDRLTSDLVTDVLEAAGPFITPGPVRVINATGIVLHTNLGRSVLSPKAVDELLKAASDYTDLEFDLSSGVRSSRLRRVVHLLRLTAGAEDALVVNNNAAAVLLALTALASGREVIVSRGQLVEIGGSFRLPAIMEQSGCRLREVGTTNRTYISDYERAITPDTALLLQVHPSNFRIEGFSAEVDIRELAALGRATGIPVMSDVGSGVLLDLAQWGITGEPTVSGALAEGADVVTFSGDKLLGGPQAGLIVGRADLVGRMRSHPLLRAVRMDKLTLAALEATLAAYADPETARNTIPTLRMLTEDTAELAARAERMAQAIGITTDARIRLRPGSSAAGGGSLPQTQLPTTLVEVRSRVDGTELGRRLRECSPPVIVRVDGDGVALDPRTVSEDDIGVIAAAFRTAIGREEE